MVAAAKRRRDDYNRDVQHAWNTIRVFVETWNRRLPDPQMLMVTDHPPKPLNTRQKAEMHKAFFEARGYKLQPMTQETLDAIKRGPFGDAYRNPSPN